MPDGVRRRQGRWLADRMDAFAVERDYWRQLFERTGSRVYVTWYRFDERIFSIAQTMRDLGGVTALYQRSVEANPGFELTAVADVMFGFSAMGARQEAASGSTIDQYIVVGYLGDHRLDLLRPAAARIRETLHATGAKRILGFTDENSADDSRWHTGHEFMRVNYAAVLQWLLKNAEAGLVLKPKRPSTLRSRLGPVASLLVEAEATGRCYVCASGPMHSNEPPMLAALAADVMVHGHLCAGTAAMEAALTGTPTLLMDREGWPRSPFYELGTGTVVFREWDELLAAVTEHFRRPGAIKGFGDWSRLLPELDPFRDGQAARRMGTYLNELITGLKQGRHRDDVLADAAARYAARWGADKVLQVKGRQSGSFAA